MKRTFSGLMIPVLLFLTAGSNDFLCSQPVSKDQTMAWAINNRIISKRKNLPVVMKAWDAMVNNSLHPNGFPGYVQETGKEPKDSKPAGYDTMPNFEDFGLGCFLLAGSEIYKLK